MRIINTYVRVGSPMFVPLSERCRLSILRCKASSEFIFGRARQEVMVMLGGSKSKGALVSAAPLRFAKGCTHLTFRYTGAIQSSGSTPRWFSHVHTRTYLQQLRTVLNCYHLTL